MRHLLALAALYLGCTATAFSQAPAPDPEALFAAIRADDLAQVEQLFDAGISVDVRYPSNKMTPLIRSSAAGQTPIVAALLQRGADTSAVDDQLYGPFDYAMERSHYDIALLLLNHWRQIAPSGSEKIADLALAATQGDLSVVDTLLKEGIAVDAEGSSGYTALGLAVRWQREALVERLLAAGADANRHSRSRYQSTPLMEASREGSVAIANRLLTAGASVNEGDKHGDHALNWAAFFGHAAFVKLMLEHGADLSRTGQTDEIAIEIAIREKHDDVVALLRAAGAKPRPKKE